MPDEKPDTDAQHQKLLSLYKGLFKKGALQDGWRVKIKRYIGPDPTQEELDSMPDAAQIHFLKHKVHK